MWKCFNMGVYLRKALLFYSTKLLCQLPNVVYKTDISDWEHLDFIWGIDARDRVYDPIVNIIKQYENGGMATWIHSCTYTVPLGFLYIFVMLVYVHVYIYIYILL